MRYETQPYEKIILCKFILNVFLRRKGWLVIHGVKIKEKC